MYLPNKVYDILKWLAQLILPASAALYFALANTWSLPFPEEIVGTIVAVDVWLGALIGISNMQYQDAKDLQPTPDVTFPWHMSSVTYEWLKWGIRLFFPATAALYLALANLWHFPLGQEIVATVGAASAFLAVLFGIGASRSKS